MPASFTQKSGDFRETEGHIAYDFPKVHMGKQKHLQMTPLQKTLHKIKSPRRKMMAAL